MKREGAAPAIFENFWLNLEIRKTLWLFLQFALLKNGLGVVDPGWGSWDRREPIYWSARILSWAVLSGYRPKNGDE